MKLKIKIFFVSVILLTSVVFALNADAAERFKLVFNDAKLVYVPDSGTLQISSQGNVLSYGKDWKVKKMKTYLYAMKQKNWKDFFWKVNTSRKEVYLIKDVDFGQMGGTSKTLEGIEVEPHGDAMNPDRFTLAFKSAYMAYIPKTKTQQLISEGMVLSYCKDWKVKALKSYLYHFKQNVWKNFYWHVNSSRKSVHKVTGAKFGKMGGKLTKLDIEVVTY